MEIVVMKMAQVLVRPKTIRVNAEVRDSGSYMLIDEDGTILRDGDETYVPAFFPSDHDGDYLYLDIDIETGQITNWVTPTAAQIRAFIEGDGD